MVNRNGEPPFIRPYDTLIMIYEMAVGKILDDKQTKLEDMITADEGIVKYGNRTVLAEAPGEEESCRAEILAAVGELVGTTEAMTIRQSHQDLEEAIVKAKRSLEEILLYEVVPGECRVCRRLGM